MSTRRLLAWVGVYVAAGLAILGFFLFVVGLTAELLFSTQPLDPQAISPQIQIAVAGLCLSAFMVAAGFVLVGLLLARQTRRQAPGYGEAVSLMEQLQFQQALPLLERAIKMGRETPDLLMLLANAYAHTGQLAKAQATADRAVTLYPQDSSAYIALANGYRIQASYDAAAEVLQRALQLEPHQPIVWAELGLLHVLTGDKKAAQAALQQAILSDDLPPMYRVRASYHLARLAKASGNEAQAQQASAEMLRSAESLAAWKPLVQALHGTAYGQTLNYEIAAIDDAIARQMADSQR